MNNLSKEERLLKAIFTENDIDKEENDEDYPKTTIEKISFSELLVANSLQGISRAIIRLSRIHRLLTISHTLPDIITNNEVRVALEALLPVENDIKEVTDMLTEIYRETKPKKQANDSVPTGEKGEK